MIEVNSIAMGIEMGDVMLKTASVKLTSAQASCPGKYIIIVQGGVSEVKSSVEEGISLAGRYLVDSFIIPNIDSQIFSALACSSEISHKDAIGVIETFSLAACISVSDISVKAADVDLIEIRLGRGLGGKAFVVMTGNVSAVKHAIETAESHEGVQGLIVKTTIIPSPHPDILNALL